MSALAFLRSFSDGEVAVIAFLAFTVVSLLGLMTNAILGSRGFGIAGNAVFIAAGGALALWAHDWLVRQPEIPAAGVTPNALLIGLMALCGTAVLLGAATVKRRYG